MDTSLFQFLATFLKSNSGLILTADKGYLVNSRLQPVATAHGCACIPDLVRKLQTAASSQLKTDVIEAMTTNETSFFRDRTPFDTLRDHVLPKLIERRQPRRSLRILCAAASTGQEPYSIAMVLAEMAPKLAGWNIEIHGIDLDTRVLSKAQAGVYSQFEVQRGLPVQLLMKYFTQCPDQTWQVKPEIRKMISFKQRNLLQPLVDLGKYDIVFCRNVLIYFDPPTMKDVLERVSSQMSDDAYLYLGGAETVLNITDKLTPLRDFRGVYVPQGRPAYPRLATA